MLKCWPGCYIDGPPAQLILAYLKQSMPEVEQALPFQQALAKLPQGSEGVGFDVQHALHPLLPLCRTTGVCQCCTQVIICAVASSRYAVTLLTCCSSITHQLLNNLLQHVDLCEGGRHTSRAVASVCRAALVVSQQQSGIAYLLKSCCLSVNTGQPPCLFCLTEGALYGRA